MEIFKRQQIAFILSVWTAAIAVGLGRYFPVDYSAYSVAAGVVLIPVGYCIPRWFFARFNATAQLALKLLPLLFVLFGFASSIANNRILVYGKDFDTIIMGMTMLATFMLIGLTVSRMYLRDLELVPRS